MSGAVVDAVVFGTQFAGVALSLHGHYLPAWEKRWAALTAAIGLFLSLQDGYWAGAGFCALTLVLLGRDWWNRKGRKAAKALGLKSLAVLAVIVAKAREAGSAPVPEGARA